MKRFFLSLLTIVILWSGTAFAIPLLQLDIAGGSYDTLTETIVAQPGNSLTLYAILTPKVGSSEDEIVALLSTDYFISSAVVPTVAEPGENLGSFTWTPSGGSTTNINVTGDMTFGTPPIETNVSFDPQDLSKHGVFPTYFWEFPFKFSSSNTAGKYNTQDNSGGPDTTGTGAFFASFDVDTSNLPIPLAIHFDLYNLDIKNDSDIDVDDFAPFSHDAQSTPIPEPTTMLLLSSGILALTGLRKKFKLA